MIGRRELSVFVLEQLLYIYDWYVRYAFENPATDDMESTYRDIMKEERVR